MRSLRTDLTLALGGIAVLLALFGLSQGCRPERPDSPGQNPAVNNGGGEGDTTPPEDTVPDEPEVPLRKELQSRGYTVVTIDPSLFFSWIDGELAAGPDVDLRLKAMLETKPDLKVAVLLSKVEQTPWMGLVTLKERMHFLGIPYKLVFAGYPGLAPAVTVEEGAPPPAHPTPPDGPPVPPPGGAGSAGH